MVIGQNTAIILQQNSSKYQPQRDGSNCAQFSRESVSMLRYIDNLICGLPKINQLPQPCLWKVVPDFNSWFWHISMLRHWIRLWIAHRWQCYWQGSTYLGKGNTISLHSLCTGGVPTWQVLLYNNCHEHYLTWIKYSIIPDKRHETNDEP